MATTSVPVRDQSHSSSSSTHAHHVGHRSCQTPRVDLHAAYELTMRFCPRQEIDLVGSDSKPGTSQPPSSLITTKRVNCARLVICELRFGRYVTSQRPTGKPPAAAQPKKQQSEGHRLLSGHRSCDHCRRSEDRPLYCKSDHKMGMHSITLLVVGC